MTQTAHLLQNLPEDISTIYAISPNALNKLRFFRMYGLASVVDYSNFRKTCEKHEAFSFCFNQADLEKEGRRSAIVIKRDADVFEVEVFDFFGNRSSQYTNEQMVGVNSALNDLVAFNEKETEPKSKGEGERLAERALQEIRLAFELRSPATSDAMIGRLDGAHGISGVNDILLRATEQFPEEYCKGEGCSTIQDCSREILRLHYWPILRDFSELTAEKGFSVAIVSKTAKYRGTLCSDQIYLGNSDELQICKSLANLTFYNEMRAEPVICKADFLELDDSERDSRWEAIDQFHDSGILIPSPTGNSDLMQHETNWGSEFLVFVDLKNDELDGVRQALEEKVIKELCKDSRVRTIEVVKVSPGKDVFKGDVLFHFVGNHEGLHEVISTVHEITVNECRDEPVTRIVTPIHSLLPPKPFDCSSPTSGSVSGASIETTLRLAKLWTDNYDVLKEYSNDSDLDSPEYPYKAFFLTENMVTQITDLVTQIHVRKEEIANNDSLKDLLLDLYFLVDRVRQIRLKSSNKSDEELNTFFERAIEKFRGGVETKDSGIGSNSSTPA